MDQQNSSIMTAAQSLMAAHNKKSLEVVARRYGWKGDPARTPMVNLAIHVATAQQREQQQQPGQQPSEQQPSEQQPSEQQPSEQQPSEQQPSEQPGEQQQQPENAEQQQQPENAEQQQQEREQQEKDEIHGENHPQPEQQPENAEQQQPEQQPEQPKRPHEDITYASAKEWKKLLAVAGIVRAHPMLRKVFNLTLQPNINVYLKGPAASGKSTLAQQLAKVRAAYLQRKVAYDFLSVTEGMSESHLLGTRMPGESGAFQYFPSGFVQLAVTGGVFLMDELDAGNSNVILLLNACLANGMFSVPMRTDCPIVHRHADHVVIGGGNTDKGAGPDEMYSARIPLDGSTADRFYQVVIEYDAIYEASLFGIDTPSVPVIKDWAPCKDRPSAETFAAAYRWFIALRQSVEELKLPRIVGRTAQQLIGALHAGVSLREAKDDQLCAWSEDEKRRVLAAIAAKGI